MRNRDNNCFLKYDIDSYKQKKQNSKVLTKKRIVNKREENEKQNGK